MRRWLKRAVCFFPRRGTKVSKNYSKKDLVQAVFHQFHNVYMISQCVPYFTISTKLHNFNKTSQFWQKFTISTKFHNFDQISQFPPTFTISTEYHNFNQISQCVHNFTMVWVAWCVVPPMCTPAKSPRNQPLALQLGTGLGAGSISECKLIRLIHKYTQCVKLSKLYWLSCLS